MSPEDVVAVFPSAQTESNRHRVGVGRVRDEVRLGESGLATETQDQNLEMAVLIERTSTSVACQDSEKRKEPAALPSVSLLNAPLDASVVIVQGKETRS